MTSTGPLLTVCWGYLCTTSNNCCEVVVDGLTNNQNYIFWVKAENEIGLGEQSVPKQGNGSWAWAGVTPMASNAETSSLSGTPIQKGVGVYYGFVVLEVTWTDVKAGTRPIGDLGCAVTTDSSLRGWNNASTSD